MADLIVKDIQQAQQTRMVTPDYQAPNNLGNMMEGLGRVGLKIADSFADMNAKQTKEAASAQSKDNSEMTADFRRLHDARRAGSMSDEEYNIKYQDTVERWSATKSYSDINNASAITGNTPFTDYQKDLDTKIKDRQQSIDSMLDSIATSLMGPTGTDEQRKLIATKALMNSIGEVDTTGALKQFTDPKERDQFLQSRLGTLFSATTDSLESFIRANGGEINQVVLDKFRQQRLKAYTTAGYPTDFSNKLIEQVVAPYQSIADLRTTNVEKATKMQEALTKNLQTGVADKFARLSIPVQFTTTENGKKVTKTMLTTGAELQELKGIAPQTVDTIVANNYTGILNAYASDGTTSLSEDDYKYIIGPSGIGKDIVYNTKSSKSTSVSLAEKANNEVNNTVKTMTPEQMKENNYGTASMQAFNNMFGMADVEDLKANPEVWERREQLITKAAQSAAIEINKISDGEGSLLADLNGNLRYFKAVGGTGSVYDRSDAGWMIPLGDQDAIMVRDTAVASAKEMINNMAKFVGMKEAIRIFNNEAVKNNEVLRRYANGIRQGSEYASETVHFEDLPITNKEAEAAAEALLNMPEPGSYEDKRRALKQSVKEAGLAATGAYAFDWLFTKAFEGSFKERQEARDRIFRERRNKEQGITDIRDTTEEDWLVKPVSGEIHAPAQVHGFVKTDEEDSYPGKLLQERSEKVQKESKKENEEFYSEHENISPTGIAAWKADIQNRLGSGEMKKRELRGMTVDEYVKAEALRLLYPEDVELLDESLNRAEYALKNPDDTSFIVSWASDLSNAVEAGKIHRKELGGRTPEEYVKDKIEEADLSEKNLSAFPEDD